MVTNGWAQTVMHSSWTEWTIPSALNKAMVDSMLMKPSLELTMWDNLEPVSNFPLFLCNIKDKVEPGGS